MSEGLIGPSFQQGQGDLIAVKCRNSPDTDEESSKDGKNWLGFHSNLFCGISAECDIGTISAIISLSNQ